MTNQKFQRYMRLSEAMKYLNIKSYATLHKLINDGLKITVVGQLKRIDQKDADEYMASHKQ